MTKGRLYDNYDSYGNRDHVIVHLKLLAPPIIVGAWSMVVTL